MRIGVIGSGWSGGTVGGQRVKAGHDGLFFARQITRRHIFPEEPGSRASAGDVAAAAAFGRVVPVATPDAALPAIARDDAETLHDKIVPNAANPRPAGPFLGDGERDGVGATSAQWLPKRRRPPGRSDAT